MLRLLQLEEIIQENFPEDSQVDGDLAVTRNEKIIKMIIAAKNEEA